MSGTTPTPFPPSPTENPSSFPRATQASLRTQLHMYPASFLEPSTRHVSLCLGRNYPLDSPEPCKIRSNAARRKLSWIPEPRTEQAEHASVDKTTGDLRPDSWNNTRLSRPYTPRSPKPGWSSQNGGEKQKAQRKITLYTFPPTIPTSRRRLLLCLRSLTARRSRCRLRARPEAASGGSRGDRRRARCETPAGPPSAHGLPPTRARLWRSSSAHGQSRTRALETGRPRPSQRPPRNPEAARLRSSSLGKPDSRLP